MLLLSLGNARARRIPYCAFNQRGAARARVCEALKRPIRGREVNTRRIVMESRDYEELSSQIEVPL
jgi:hypothetical protein